VLGPRSAHTLATSLLVVKSLGGLKVLLPLNLFSLLGFVHNHLLLALERAANFDSITPRRN
jgi:hypothetical protein